MPKQQKTSWYVYAGRGGMVLFGAGFIGLAVTVGAYKQKVDRMESDLSTFKVIHDFDKRLAVLEERTKGSNSSLPITPPTVRPTAGKQR